MNAMDPEMNILYLSAIIPYPLEDGDCQRCHHLLRALAKKHTVHFLGFMRAPDEARNLKHLKKYCATTQGVLLTRAHVIGNCLRTWWGARPLNVTSYQSRAMAAAAREVARQHRIQGVHAYRLRMAPYALGIPAEFRVLDYTDSLTRHFENRLRTQTGSLKRAYLKHEAIRLRAYETEVSRQFSASIISSHLDREWLQTLGASDTMAEVTNGVDTRYFTPAPKLTRAPELLFVGNLEYPPNLWGLREFCQRTWPLIRKKQPDARLTVIGRQPRDFDREPVFRQPGVQYLGVVPDLRPYFRRARAAICPLEVASGRQFKMIEYFAAGVPAVASPLVAENVAARPGQHCLVGGSPTEFSRQVLRLLSDRRLADRIRRAARKLALEKYDWKVAARQLQTVYRPWEAKRKPRRRA